jgi:serine/threonine-protein kinase HipA
MSARRELAVWINNRYVGTLASQDDIWRFQYASAWLADAQCFALAPGFALRADAFVDGSDNRPVQWYFDNLLPEEQLRSVLAREANIAEADAFGLLAHYGAESAGSLVLNTGSAVSEQGWRALSLDNLNARIANLSQATLNQSAPKRMSLAGAQHKMVVGYRDGQLYEPLPGTASTHILKPESQSPHYPHSVINEFFCMSLARRVGLDVPDVHLLYVPRPVYVVKRFDRATSDRVTPDRVTLDRVTHDGQEVQRLHIIDTCQLLNRSRAFKYAQANVDTLAQAIALSHQKAADRLRLFDWLVFNVLIGNGDNHLKNLSFHVTHEGVRLAPGYDLLCTAVYETRAFSDAPIWPRTQLAMGLCHVNQFDGVTRDVMLQVAQHLGVPASIANRTMDAMLKRITPAADDLITMIERRNSADMLMSDPAAAGMAWAGEMRLLRSIRYTVLTQTVQQLQH